MLILIGKTASGKTAIVKKLNKRGYHSVITTTTRPMRQGEKQDVDYHFISEEDFLRKIDNGYFAEWKVYETKQGNWYYGCSMEDLQNADEKTVIILTPDGCRDVINKMVTRPTIFYVYSNIATIKKRLLKRKDNKDEAERRIENDNKDFKNAELLADRIFYNNEGQDLNELVESIIAYKKEGVRY